MSPARMSHLESAIRTVLAFNAAFNRQDVAAMLELVSPDCLLESSAPQPDGTRHTGTAALARFWTDFFNRAPDAHAQIEEIFSLGERCIMRWNLTWTDGSGTQQHQRGVDILRVRAERISELFSYAKH
jgi:ketosteroid isomerase-like protein